MFETLSTGFAEAVAIGAPTLIYNNEFDYNLASKYGKKINDLLYQSDIIFYDEKNDMVAFSGSSNETRSGWVDNFVDYFPVTCAGTPASAYPMP